LIEGEKAALPKKAEKGFYTDYQQKTTAVA